METQRDIATETVFRGTCVGCGTCVAVCPSGAVSMRFDSRRGMPVPEIDADKCVRCGLCSKTCVHSAENLAALCRRVASAPDPERVGLENARGFLAWDPRPGRAKSASGGVVTAVARELLRQGRIAGVIHAERVAAKRGEPHYRAVLSKTPDEVAARRGSAYEPLDFSEVLATLDPSATYLVVGTPCVVRNFKALEKAPGGPRPKFVACALVCSHNVTARFADFMADRVGIPRETPFFYDPRDKDGTPDAGNFNTRFRGTDNDDLYKENRFASGWTKYWRDYAFALPACCRCPDFWGMEADLSMKDAWGRSDWTADPLGKSIAIFRNADMLRIAQSAGLEMMELPERAYAGTQRPQTAFKQRAAADKVSRPVLSRVNFCNGLFRTTVLSAATRWTFPRFGAKAAATAFAAARAPFLVWDTLLAVRKALRTRFRVQEKTRTILVAGGHGYGNAGDEAQCAATLRLLSDRYPGFEVADLSPNPDYSRRVHPGFHHEWASRNLFFDHRFAGDLFALDTFGKRIRFLWTMALVRANASLVKRNLPTLLINARKASMLRRISEASLLYFSGGGYLTGATRSRLWDGALLCRLCHVFGVPVAMSGQTIGVWPKHLDRWIARWGFRHVDVIATRDNKESLADLKDIGFPGSAFPTHDDALLCDKSPVRQIGKDRYLLFNFHFWGMEDESLRLSTLAKMHEAVVAAKARFPGRFAVFLPMAAADMVSFHAFSARYPQDGLSAFECGYDYRRIRRAIADADLVVTMKHHPIIFAVGEDVPVVSLAFSPYYLHKNFGALQQYGAERFCVDLSADGWFADFDSALLALTGDVASYRETLRKNKVRLAARKEAFLGIVDKLLRAAPRKGKDESPAMRTQNAATVFYLPALDAALSRNVQRRPGPDARGLAVYSGEWPIVERAYPGLSFKRAQDLSADESPAFAFVWGSQPRPINFGALESALRRGASLVVCEDGFLKSADTWANESVPLRYRRGCSLVTDSRGFYFDATKPTDIERMLEDRSLVVSPEERAEARRLIDRIVREKVTKYNHQPIFVPEVGRPGRRKVLVVDQSYGDFSILRGLADESTFSAMLADAIAENPDADILVKTHPDAMTGTRKGYYDGVVETDRVLRVTMPINPYSLMEIVDKVYVCSTQLGFEALMAGREVHVYGMPFYAGWGLTVDRQKCPRRTNSRSLEEAFHIFYNLYTRWLDPETGEPWTVDRAIDHLVALRAEYAAFRKPVARNRP